MISPARDKILTINSGSSSIKFAVYGAADGLPELLSGEIRSIGGQDTQFTFKTADTKEENIRIAAADHVASGHFLADWLAQRSVLDSIKGIGHRIVHGMSHAQPEVVTPALLDDLKKITPFDPEHLPDEIRLIELFGGRCPDTKQIACFDTAFHASMPPVAKMLAIPRRYYRMGICRYGFHGLSYTFLMEELKRQTNEETANGRVILAHLGNGASLAAVTGGKSADTSMGFTPTSGLPMGTRAGDLDPGVAAWLMRAEKMTSEAFGNLINYESGLIGISETNADMRELLKLREKDSRAAEAVDLFCYQARKWIGSFSAVLGGLDTLVFSGGIGAHSPEIRSQICNELGFLGIELDEAKNRNSDPVISAQSARVSVRVIHTNEELTIARAVARILNIS